mmetsp:Transcript_3788/g.3904  ORF Transcript_3788/g.3904 Transcript_3788/m.3904 type:complete len:404 (-) Transcript_3788:118-1329(-)
MSILSSYIERCIYISRLNFKNCRTRKYDEVSQLLRTSPEHICFQDADGFSILHKILASNPPVRVVKKLFSNLESNLWCYALMSRNKFGQTPVHSAVLYSSTMVLRFLVRLCPEGLRVQDYHGHTPLHLACSIARAEAVSIILSLSAGVANITNSHGANSLAYMSYWCYETEVNKALRTKIDDEQDLNDILRLKSNCTSDGAHLVENCWRSASLLVKVSYHGSIIEPLPCNKTWRVLHACLGIEECPINMVLLAIRLHPEQLYEADEDGNFPLHIAAANSTINGVSAPVHRQVREEEEDTEFEEDDDNENYENLISMLARLNPLAANHVNSNGRMPLHEAISSGKQWDNGIESLVNSARHSVTHKDENVTNLFPFMMAASAHGGCLDTTYNLLRQCPELNRLKI